MERIIGKNVVRPDIAGIMGAYGAAIVAKENYVEGTKSSILGPEELDAFTIENSHARCGRCENNCLLTINKFSDGSKYITGNRCEKGEGKAEGEKNIPNLYDYKFKRLFKYKPLSEEESRLGTIGIPRVLNMYENYPFWFTFFTKLGYRVVLSPQSSKAMYETGMETISSDTACYPAKLVHGHIQWLVDQGVKWIFYPSINYEKEEDDTAPNHYNCPIVATYPEVIANNMDDVFEEAGVRFSHPFLPYDAGVEVLARELYNTLNISGASPDDIVRAVIAARDEDSRYHGDVRKAGEYALRYEIGRAHV